MKTKKEKAIITIEKAFSTENIEILIAEALKTNQNPEFLIQLKILIEQMKSLIKKMKKYPDIDVIVERINLLAKENEKLRDELDRAKNLGFK